MSYWSHHPEKLDEITAASLPEPWRSRCEDGEIDLDDVPASLRDKAMDDGIADYWGSKIDEAEMREDR